MKKVLCNVSKKPMKIFAFIMSLALLVTSVSGMGFVFAADHIDVQDAAASQARAIAEASKDVDVNPNVQADEKAGTNGLTPVKGPDGKDMFVVNSTFYDYYSDSQVAGAKGNTPGAINDGVYGTKDRATDNSFSKFNTMLLEKSYTGTYDPAVSYKLPLYCGLFFGDQNNSVNGDFYYKADSGRALNAAKKFWLGANSSQRGGGTLGNYTDVNAVTQGLVDNTLSASGNVTQEGKNLPYFDKSFLAGTNFTGTSLPLGEVKENVSFPFRTVVKDDVTTYEFDSWYDTVRFNSSNQLDYKGYNDKFVKDNGSTYDKSVQVLDQKNDDDNKSTGPKPGFFPYNEPKDSSSTRLDYGFGVKLDIPFYMTKDGKINGKDITFHFSGDDDVWVFIDGYLVLDLGGAHGRAEGNINFTDQTTYVSAVKNNKVAFSVSNAWYVGENAGDIDLDVTTKFPSELVTSLKNTNEPHTLTMFYMERGKIESNMKINFNLPQPNTLTVTNKITMDRVNDALKPATKEQTSIEEFNYDVKEQTPDGEAYDIGLLDKGTVTYQDKFNTGSVMDVTETKLADADRTLKNLYDTTWDLNDPYVQISNSKDRDNYAASDDRSTKDDTFLFLNQSNAPTTNLTVNYVNDVLVGDLVFRKELVDAKEYDGEEFEFKVIFSNVFGGPSKAATYEGAYSVIDGDSVTEKTTKDGIIKLKAGQAVRIQGVPVETKYEIKELTKGGSYYSFESISKYGTDNYEYKDQTATGIISKEANSNEFTFVNKKVEVPVTEAPATPTPEPTPDLVTPPAVTATPSPEPTATPTVKPTDIPTPIPTVVPTATPKPTNTPEPIGPADIATEAPTATPKPTVEPTAEPTAEPSEEPLEIPDYNNPPADDEEPDEEEPVEEEPDEEEPDEETPTKEKKKVKDDTPAASPKTGDTTNIIFWILSVVVSAGAVFFTGKELFWRKKEK